MNILTITENVYVKEHRFRNFSKFGFETEFLLLVKTSVLVLSKSSAISVSPFCYMCYFTSSYPLID